MLICDQPITALAVGTTGNVYLCCHGSEQVGNLVETPLLDIWHGAMMRAQQALNAHGKLPCMSSCRLTQNFRAHQPEDAKPRLQHLTIVADILCNIRCVMCYQNPQRDLRKRTGVLNAELLWRQIPFADLDEVILQGGEPTVIPACRDLLRRIHQLPNDKPRVALITNGLVMDSELVNILTVRGSTVHFSLNAATPQTHERINVGSSWQKVLRHIHRLREARDAQGSRARLIGHMALVPENLAEIAAFIRSFAGFGLDAVTFGYDRTSVPEALASLAPDAHASLRHGVHSALQQAAPGAVRWNTLAQLGLWEAT